MGPRRIAAAAVLCAVTSACGWVSDEPSPDDPVREGSRVTGTGRVEALPGHPVRLCASTIGFPRERPEVPCESGVDVTGVDLGALADRREEDGVVTGRALLTGTWRDGVLAVEDQERPRAAWKEPRPTHRAGSTYSFAGDASPCPLPEVGSRGARAEEDTGVVSPALERFFRAHPGSRPFHALRRPAVGQLIHVLAVQDDAERADAERILRPVLGERLCVVDASVTPAEVEAAQQDPALQVGPGALAPFATGLGMRDDLSITPEYSVGVVMITEELRRAADAHPDGLVALEPMLRVVG